MIPIGHSTKVIINYHKKHIFHNSLKYCDHISKKNDTFGLVLRVFYLSYLTVYFIFYEILQRVYPHKKSTCFFQDILSETFHRVKIHQRICIACMIMIIDHNLHAIINGDHLWNDGVHLWHFVSSVSSSNSHPDLLLTQHHPLFQITQVLNTGLSLSEPLQLYKGYTAI